VNIRIEQRGEDWALIPECPPGCNCRRRDALLLKTQWQAAQAVMVFLDGRSSALSCDEIRDRLREVIGP
jgi:hypothetical protein